MSNNTTDRPNPFKDPAAWHASIDNEVASERRTIARPTWATNRRYELDGIRYSDTWTLTGVDIDGSYDLVIELSVSDYVDADDAGTFLARSPVEVSLGRRVPEDASEEDKAWAGAPIRLSPLHAKELAVFLAMAAQASDSTEERVDNGGIEEDNEST